MKKLGLLLASFGAGLLLVGGTLAAAIVTDNADPFGVKVTPGTIGLDENDAVTLSWGESTGKSIRHDSAPTQAVAAIENIGAGETVGPYFVNVKATVTATSVSEQLTSYEGTFKITLVDNSGKTSSEERFIDHVKVYATKTKHVGTEGAHPIPTYANAQGIATVASGSNLTAELDITAPSGTEVPVYLYVALENVSVAVYDQISGDNISMTVDWMPKAGDQEEEPVTTNTIYFSKGSVSEWGDVYVYAFYGSGNTAKKNANWPGVNITSSLANGLYSYELGSLYTTVIFNNGDGNGKQTADLSLASVNLTTTPKYEVNGTVTDNKYQGAWGSAAVTEKEYWLVGIIGGETDWSKPSTNARKLTKMDTTEFVQYKLEGITLSVGDEVKVIDADGNYYPNGDNWKVTQDVVKVGSSAIFNIYFAPNGDSTGGEGWQSNTLCVTKPVAQ